MALEGGVSPESTHSFFAGLLENQAPAEIEISNLQDTTEALSKRGYGDEIFTDMSRLIQQGASANTLYILLVSLFKILD